MRYECSLCLRRFTVPTDVAKTHGWEPIQMEIYPEGEGGEFCEESYQALTLCPCCAEQFREWTNSMRRDQ